MSETITPFKTFVGESRCVNTADMLRLYDTASTLCLNRNLEPATAQYLDPEGVHVLTLILVNHQAHASRELPLHHRTSTLLKIRDSAKPLAVFLDVTDEQWQRLLTLSEAKTLPDYAATGPGKPLNLPSRLTAAD